jgi:hypothetical protein
MFLNQAFDIMIRSISRNGGIVNKFGGDMVMGVWNAPNEVDDHAAKACLAAVEALREMAEKNLAIPDDPDAKFGFGINREAVAGNVGSAGRLEQRHRRPGQRWLAPAASPAAARSTSASGRGTWLASTWKSSRWTAETLRAQPSGRGLQGPER